ncbi:hypothetical protein CN272_27955 [Bacillus anthracis]|nr:hypothetical protein CN272_27955 [Bacillus anthracis]PFD87204.1 hypothetical protein CN275_20255 [Bacillus anthracis]PFT20057.1 hypothetical protein COK52_22745 [Bacillus thuringiensis]
MSRKHVMKKFKEKVNSIPDKLAIIDNQHQYTYAELDAITDKVAFYLKKKGVEVGAVVPLLLKPSTFTVVSILSLYKLGAAYLPISTKFPYHRIQYLLDESSSNLFITDIILDNDFDQEAINVEEIKKEIEELDKIDLKLEIGDFAYILYTSGSTGNPKGVIISQDNLMHILENMQKYYPIKQSDKYLLTTPYTFDVSVVEIFGWVLGGGSLVISNSESTEGLRELIPQIKKHNITHMALSPSILNMLLNVSSSFDIKIINENLKYLMIAGEEFKPSLAKKTLELLPDVQVDNLYGPTEATIYTTRYTLKESEIQEIVPIGKELDNVQIKILDLNKEEVANGQVGELYISGEGLSMGYHNLPDVTHAKFSILNKNLYYATGDLCKRLSNGDIVFLGRIDSQVQINGIRVELGEIENTILKKIDDIEMAKVLYHEKKLYCFYKLKQGYKNIKLKELLEEHLPTYMIPSLYDVVEEFPLTTNGKIDSKCLLENFNQHNLMVKEELNVTEEIIKNIFCEVLKIKSDKVSKVDNFFNNLGGDSLANITCILQLEAKFDISLDDDFLYRYSSIEQISRYLLKNKSDVKVRKESQSISNPQSVGIDFGNLIKQSREKNNEIFLDSGIKDAYEAYYLQKVYFFDEFKTTVDIEVTLDKKQSLQAIKKAYIGLLNNHELLRSILVNKNNKLFFNEFNLIKEIDIPVINLSFSIEPKSLKQYIQEIKQCLHSDLVENTIGNLLHRVALIKTNNNYKLLLVLSHHIADYSNVHIIKKEIFNNLELQKNNLGRKHYKEFIDFVNKNNNLEDIICDGYTKELDSIGKQELLVEAVDDLLVLSTEKPRDKNTPNKIISYINYLTSQLLCNTLNKEKIIISTIYNVRDFENICFENCIGDYHSSVTLYGIKNESYRDFEDRMDQLIRRYQKGYNPMNEIFKTYPEMNEKQKYLEKIYDLNPSVKTNYLGELRGESIDELYDSLELTKEQLSKFPVSRVYMTCFSTVNEIRLIFLTKPNVQENILDKLGLKISEKVVSKM